MKTATLQAGARDDDELTHTQLRQEVTEKLGEVHNSDNSHLCLLYKYAAGIRPT